MWNNDGMNDKIKILMEDAILVKNRAYFFSRYWNALYVVDFELGKTQFVSTMPEEDITAERLCAGIAYHNGKLFLVPMAAKKIWIYDLKEKSWQGLERKYIADGDQHGEMFRAIKYKNSLFFIGSNYPAIIRMDLNNYKLEYKEDPYAFLLPIKSKFECYFRADFLHLGNQVFLASCLNSFVLCLNLDTFDFTWHQVGEDGFRYSGIAWDGEYYWLSPRTGTPIVKWDGKNKAEYFPLPNEFNCDRNNFLGVQYDSGKLFFPGMGQNSTIELNPRKPNEMEIQEGRYTFYRCFDVGGKLSQTVDGLFQWRYSDQSKAGKMYCEIEIADLKKYFRTHLRKTNHINFKKEIKREPLSFGLSLYLSMIEPKTETENKEANIGEIIWKSIRN